MKIISECFNVKACHTGRQMELLWFCTRNSILYGQKWVLFNKNKYRLTKFITYYKFKFCHTKLSFSRQKLLLSWQNSFLYHRLYFCYLILKLVNKSQFWTQISLVWILWTNLHTKLRNIMAILCFVTKFNFVFTKLNSVIFVLQNYVIHTCFVRTSVL